LRRFGAFSWLDFRLPVCQCEPAFLYGATIHAGMQFALSFDQFAVAIPYAVSDSHGNGSGQT
jgi:hypothetical protein